jgi:tetratricopeptide (TPR) repeat protein
MALLACSGPVAAGEPHAAHGVDFRVHCAAAVRGDFDRALALLHHMTYPQARSAFVAIQQADPTCAMAYWGEAMTLFQPLWPTRPSLAERERGWQAVRQARALDPEDPRERAFVDMAAAFFENPASDDYWARIARWDAATRRVLDAFPKDDEARAFRALALLATTPVDRVSRDHADQAAALLQRVLAHDPDHPGAMHYMVHANDVPGREREAPDVTHGYEAVAPDNPHALHMPTHVYTRVGDWDGVVRGNLRAADAALRYPAGEHGEFVWDEFAHAIEYLVYGYLQQGDLARAKAQRDRLLSTKHLQPSFKTAFHLASVQARIPLETHDWKAAAALVPRMPATVDWDQYPWPEAIAQFAHGMGAARSKQMDDAKAASARIFALEAKMAAAKEPLFERNIRVLRLELDATIAQAQARKADAIALARQAVALERETPKHAVTPGPTLPAEELLGDLYAAQDDVANAREAYARALAQYPNRRAPQRALHALDAQR